MRRRRAAALWTFVQLRRVPAIGRFAGAQAHLRRFAFWNSHVCALRKHRFSEKQAAHEVIRYKSYNVKGGGDSDPF